MYCYLKTKIGTIKICEEDDKISKIEFCKKCLVKDATSELLIKATKQLNEYFCGKRDQFDLPLLIDGTDFQEKVWDALLTTKYGSTCSYKDIAEKIGNVKAVRAVGGANNKNKIPIIIPCHRVIGKSGALVGYAGGLEWKKWLLNIESSR